MVELVSVELIKDSIKLSNNEWTDRRVKGLELMSWLGEVKKIGGGTVQCLMYEGRLL